MNSGRQGVEQRAGRRVEVAVGVCVALAVLLRLPFLTGPIGADEAGFLLVADQWGDGSSLYGDYWVDRPPLLIGIFELAGGLTTLRLLGCLAAAIVVVAVAQAARWAAGDRAAIWAAATATVFCSAPWLGTVRVNGEILAAPFVAIALALTVRALVRPGSRQLPTGAAAGVAAACAALVKQTTLDGFVFAAVALGVLAWTRPARRAEAARVLAAGAAGAVATLAVVLAWASLHGTPALDMFDATVTFRFEAGETIRSSASGATTDRLVTMLATWAVSGLALIGVLALVQAVRRPDPLRVASLAVIVFTSGIAIAGGSYWAHYLVQLVPATSLAAGLLAANVRPRVRHLAAASVLVATGANLAVNVVGGIDEGTRAEQVGDALDAVAAPGDTAVVAYGQPNVLWNAGLSTPYPYLWSLPIRTLDADLADLTAVLSGPDRPTWFVDWSGLHSWGVDATRLEAELQARYTRVAEVCGRTLWLDATVDREPIADEACR